MRGTCTERMVVNYEYIGVAYVDIDVFNLFDMVCTGALGASFVIH